ncbi:MAG: TIGR04255 family protein [Oligoflexia bacterium]|nr:TIGR04255 family protein [Oligoflexia bacterium]
MSHERYTHPPIVEAVVEFRFAGGLMVDDELLKLLKAALSQDYPGDTRTTNQIQVQAQVGEAGISTAAQPSVQKVLFPSTDGLRLVGVGHQCLSLHVLQPYPGWPEFKARVETALDLYREIFAPDAIVGLAVRYIDQVVLPADPDLILAEYLVGLPDRPAAMPGGLASFHVVTQAVEPETATTAVLTLASGLRTADGGATVLYDLNLIRDCTEPPVAFDSWQEPLDELHTRQRDIFEQSITEKTRELIR